MPILKTAARIALIKNTLEGEKRSVIAKMAKTKVPTIKPNCTEEVIKLIAEAGIPNSRTKSGITAFAANQSEVQANCEKTISGRIKRRFGLSVNINRKTKLFIG